MKASHPSLTRPIVLAGLLVLLVFVLGLGLDSQASAAARPQALVWGPNVRANSDDSGFGQHEPSLAISRTNPNVVIANAKDYRDGNIKHVWIYVSQDGGQTWPLEKQLQMPGLPGDITEQSDPVVMSRDDGRLYAMCLGYGSGHGLFITWSDDDGDTWVDSVAITHNLTPGSLDDKEWLAIDNNPLSPYYHYMYVAWSDPYGLGILFSRSIDGGATWTPYMDIFPGYGDITEYAYPVVAADGSVYVFYMEPWGYCADGYIKVVKSSDGGLSFGSPVSVVATSQPCSPIHGGGYDQWRFFSIITAAADPNNANNLWAAWTDDSNIDYGKTDVMFVRSTDGGLTWSAKQRLSHDDPEIYIDHITPVFSIGLDSTLHAFWLDRRDDLSNHLFHGYYSYSTDGGVTWAPDMRVSEEPFDLNIGFPPGSNNAAGDYWGLDTVGNVVMAAWNTTIYGEQDIFVSRGVFTDTAVLSGQVRDAGTALPIEGAQVLLDTGAFTYTNPSGVYTFTLDPGVYTVTASADGYISQTVTDVYVYYGTITQDFDLEQVPPPPVTLTGAVTDADTALPLEGAEVLLDTGDFDFTGPNGVYTFTLPPGVYTVTASADGYYPQAALVELIAGTLVQDFALQALPVELTGMVSDAYFGTPITGAQVLLNTGEFGLTDAAGRYGFSLPRGIYTMTASADGYLSQTVGVELISGMVEQDFVLVPSLCPVVEILSVDVTADGMSVTFTPTISSALEVSYLWDFGDGITSTEAAPSHVYADSGSYTVTLQVTNFCGASASWEGEVAFLRSFFIPLIVK